MARVLRLLKPARCRSERVGPFCGNATTVAATTEPPVELEVCQACSAVLMDAATFESLSWGTIDAISSLAMQATKPHEEVKLQGLKDRQKSEEAAAKRRKKRPENLKRNDAVQTGEHTPPAGGLRRRAAIFVQPLSRTKRCGEYRVTKPPA